MKLYIVTANTYEGGYGAEIELLRVTDNEADALKSKKYAESKGWTVTINTAELNKPTRKCLGGYIE